LFGHLLKIVEFIKKLNVLICLLIEKDPEFRQTFSNITPIPGVGKVQTLHLISGTNGCWGMGLWKKNGEIKNIHSLTFIRFQSRT
jgi:hypothetical protein